VRKPKPTIFEEPNAGQNEAAKARWWRERIMRITREELSTRIGYSVDSIDCYERGHNSSGRLLTDKSWLRYRNACGAIASGKTFDWVVVSSRQPEHQEDDQNGDRDDQQQIGQ
jgi:hypothetical protein